MSALVKQLMERARSLQGSVAFPESLDPRILRATVKLLEQKWMREVVLFAKPEEVEKVAAAENIPIHRQTQGIYWVTEKNPHIVTELAAFYSDHMQAKGKPVSPEAALAFAQAPVNQAGYLLKRGTVTCAIAGCVETTAAVIRAALNTVGTASGMRTVSGAFLMHRDNGSPLNFIYADSGVVIDPTSEQLVDIAAASVETIRKLVPEQPPVVAFLSFSTKGSAKHPMADKVIAATQMFKEKYPDVAADGELQFDAAFDAAIGARKCPGSPAAGKANVFIFPNLDAGNIAYKITQRLGGFEAYGPVLQGTARPYSDLSRGANVDDIVMMACINVLRAH